MRCDFRCLAQILSVDKLSRTANADINSLAKQIGPVDKTAVVVNLSTGLFGHHLPDFAQFHASPCFVFARVV